MAYSFPLNLSQFSDRLRVVGLSYHCPSPVSSSRTAGGQIMRARLGASLWQGECFLAFEKLSNTRGMRGLLDLLMDPDASFMLSPKDYGGPAADPGGALLGSAVVTISEVAANNRDLTLGGLPAGYLLSADDLLSFSYGSSPARFAMHRVVTRLAEANDIGHVTVEVWPRVAPGWQSASAVALKVPRFKATMEDKDPGRAARLFLDGMSFRFMQTLG